MVFNVIGKYSFSFVRFNRVVVVIVVVVVFGGMRGIFWMRVVIKSNILI